MFHVIQVHGHHPFTDSQILEIRQKVDALDDLDKAAFYAMANVFSPEEYPPGTI